MKWKPWNDYHWVLEAADGEVLEEVKMDELSQLYIVKSTGKKYTSAKAAQKAAEKGKKENPT